jgi:class 3 adenylate cyclase
VTRPEDHGEEAPRAVPTLRALRLWQRIHVRLTALYGVAVLLVLTPAAILTYNLAVDGQVEDLRDRIRLTTISLAAMVDARRLAEVDRADHPYRQNLAARFREVMAQESEIGSVYIFLPSDKPLVMRFFLDTDKRAKPAKYLEEYDIDPYPDLHDGLTAPVVERRPVADAWGVSLSGFSPLRDERGQAIAVVGVDWDAASVDRIQAEVLAAAAMTYGAALLLLGLAGYGVGRMLQRPMTRIIEGTEAVARGQLGTRVGLARQDDFGVLGGHFDQMAAGLEERDYIRTTFGRYVSEDVAKKLLVDTRGSILAGEERRVTVLFTDLSGYSTLSEHLAPSAVLGLMNTYLGAMNTVIDKYGGCVLEFMGDGILAVFNAPDALVSHPEWATRCAMAMRARLDEMNAAWVADGTAKAWQDHGVARLTARAGLHTGRVVAGSLGSEVRMKYSILGDTVNVAARLEQLNKLLGTDLLVSRTVYDALPPELQASATSRGTHAVKGREQEVEVFSL